MLAPWNAPRFEAHYSTGRGKDNSTFQERWVSYDETALTYEEITIPIEVNGRLRSKIVVPIDTPEEKIKEAALADPKIRPYTEGNEITKVIYVSAQNRGDLVNIGVK